MTDSTIAKRSDIYRLLAACFYEPDKQLMIEENVCANLVSLLGDTAPRAAEAAEEMQRAIETCDQQQLSIDHAALFIGPFELLAAPYGSVWLEKHRQVMGDSTMTVRKFYEDAGLAVEVSEPPDHIAIMLEFQSILCRQEAVAISQHSYDTAGQYFKRQRRFMREHLLPWVFSFCEAIERKAQNSFYEGLAMTLSRFMKIEEEFYEKSA